jgi:hypothetical protein
MPDSAYACYMSRNGLEILSIENPLGRPLRNIIPTKELTKALTNILIPRTVDIQQPAIVSHKRSVTSLTFATANSRAQIEDKIQREQSDCRLVTSTPTSLTWS